MAMRRRDSKSNYWGGCGYPFRCGVRRLKSVARNHKKGERDTPGCKMGVHCLSVMFSGAKHVFNADEAPKALHARIIIKVLSSLANIAMFPICFNLSSAQRS